MDATQIILIVFILILVIAYPILISTRNKKENQKITEQTNSLKKGDKVMTTSGVYGTIVDLQFENDKKIVTIETGSGQYKSYVSVDAYAIYTVFKDEAQRKAEEAKKQAEAKKIEEIKSEKVNEGQTEETPRIDEPVSPVEDVKDVEAKVKGRKSKAKN